MRVTLINPNWEASLHERRGFMPLGLAYIAAVLRKEAIEVEVIDAAALDLNERELRDELLCLRPDIVGITATTVMFSGAMRAAKIAKEATKAKVVMGGVHPTIMSEQVARQPATDIVVRGEGEMTMLQLVRALQSDRSLVDVNGIAFRREGEVIITPERSPIQDLDRLPLPARELFPFELYRGYETMVRRKPSAHILTSRGCPCQCTFCASESMWGRKARVRQPSPVVDEIEQLVREFGVREILLYDDTFNLDLERAEAICDEITSRRLDLTWKAQTRVKPITSKLLRKMKGAGCWCVYYGVEAGDPQVLRRTKKGVTLEEVERAFRLTKEAGLRIVAYFMLGLPGDNEVTMRRTIEYARQLDPDFAVFAITTVFPGTDLFEMCSRTRLADERAADGFFKPFSFESDAFNEADLERMRSLALKRFYLRPSYMLRQLFKIRTGEEFIASLKAAYAMLF